VSAPPFPGHLLTGTVEFFVNAESVGTATVSGGTASLSYQV